MRIAAEFRTGEEGAPLLSYRASPKSEDRRRLRHVSGGGAWLFQFRIMRFRLQLSVTEVSIRFDGSSILLPPNPL